MVQFEVLLDTSDNACFDIEPRNGKLHLAFLNVYSDSNYVFLFSYAQSWLQERSYRHFQARRGQGYGVTAIFKFKEGEKITQKVLKMSGIGKFPFINASDEKINFDQLTVGQQETKHITLRNYSLVTSKFEIEKINDDGKDMSFALSQKSGDIAPGSSQKITVTYTPTQVGAFTST